MVIGIIGIYKPWEKLSFFAANGDREQKWTGKIICLFEAEKSV